MTTPDFPQNPIRWMKDQPIITANVVICDIDGTIADLSHRLHHIQSEKKDWDAFFDACTHDTPIWDIIVLVRMLKTQGNTIVYVSGRSDRVADKTMAWLEAHGLPYGKLVMRDHGDHRPDDIVKAEMFEKVKASLNITEKDVYLALDDRSRVVKMWRSLGIRCLQVADGDF